VSTNGTRLTSTQAWVLALTSAASLMVSLDTQVVATALPVIRLQLHASLAELEWTVNAYTLTFAVLLLTGAALGERLGRRRMLATGVGLFTVASAGCALAQNATILVAARAVQGAGAALMLPLALALLSAAFPPQRRAWALGIFSSVTGIAVLAGPVVGGAVAQGLDWPWIFWLNVPIGLVMIPLILARIPAAERSRASLDPIGLLLAATSALGIVWALIRANTLGWTSPEIPATLAAGIVLGAAFIGWELRVADPMVPLRLFRSRPIAAGNAATFSVSMAIPATMSAVMTAVPPAAIGQASGTLNTLRQLGGVFGVAICAAVFAARGHYASPATFVAGFGPAMAACAGLALLGAAASLVIPGRRQAPASAVAVQPVQNHAPKIEIRR
jgi:MFS family permease